MRIKTHFSLLLIGITFNCFLVDANNFPVLHPFQRTTAMIEAVSDTVETLINEPISFNVLQNDIGEGISINTVFQPSYGALAWSFNGDFTYTPDENYVGPDVLVYQIKDEDGNTASANVFITVEGNEDLPLQISIDYECTHESSYDLWIYITGGTPPYESLIEYGDDLLNPAYQNYFSSDELYVEQIPTSMGFYVFVRDADNNTALENYLNEIICHEDVINVCAAETHLELNPVISCNDGEKTIEVVATGGSGEYTYYGQFLEESGEYAIVEDSEGCQNILFYDEVPAYTCPIANDDVVNGAYNAPFHLKPLLNDIGEGLYISDIKGLKHGTIQWKTDHFLAYTPHEDFAGIETIEYEITDIQGNTSRAQILAVVPENDEVAIFWERDCTRAEEEGVFEVQFTVAGGKPPYVIDGDFLGADYRGDELLSFVKADGDAFSLIAIDQEGESASIEVDLIPCTFEEYPASDYTVYLSCIEGENYGVLTAIDPDGEPIVIEYVPDGNLHGDTIPNGGNYTVHTNGYDFEGNEIIFEEMVFCPPVAEDDFYVSHTSYLEFPMTFNPLLNDDGHGLKLVKIETPQYGTLEWWEESGTMNYRPDSDFRGVETFDYTLEDIGGNRTSATIAIVIAHPTELQITYERNCFEVNNSGADNYGVTAYVSGGKPPYQVQINEEDFFEVSENGDSFSFEVADGEGFKIYAVDEGFVTHEALVDELEIAPCGSLCEGLALEVDLECLEDGSGVLNFEVLGANGEFVLEGNEDGDTLEWEDTYFVRVVDEQGCTVWDIGSCGEGDLVVEVETDCKDFCSDEPYLINVAILGGKPPYYISGSIDTVLEASGLFFGEVENGLNYDVKVIDDLGNELHETGKQNVCLPLEYCPETIEIENINDIFDCTCDGSIVFSIDNLSGIDEVCGIEAYLYNISSEFIELGDTIAANSNFELRYIYTENNRYCIEYEGLFIAGNVSDFCNPQNYTFEAIDDFAATTPGESVTINPLQNDTGTGLQINGVLVSPACGSIVIINPETGEIVYVADYDTDCTADTFVIEVEDECGNVTTSTVTIVIEQGNELIVQVERDCSNVESTGLYTLNVAVISGTPPYTISGSINAVLEEEGFTSVTLDDGQPYDIAVVDASGAEFFESGGEVACNSNPCDVIEIQEIEEIAECLCDGSMVITFEPLLDADTITYIEGYWSNDLTGKEIELGDTIPANGFLEIYGIGVEEGCYSIFYETDFYIFGNVSDFCSAQNPLELEYKLYCTDPQTDMAGIRVDSVINGEAPFQASFNGGEFINFVLHQGLNQLSVGNNTLLVQDANGCSTDTLEIKIDPAPAFTVSLQAPITEHIALLQVEPLHEFNAPFRVSMNSEEYQDAGNYVFEIDTLEIPEFIIRIRDTRDCESDAFYYAFRDLVFVDIEENPSPLSNLQLFPNPNNGNFTLSLQLQQAEEIEIEVFNALGQVKLWQRLHALPTVERHDFNLDVNSGLYFIRVSGKDWVWMEKMVVE